MNPPFRILRLLLTSVVMMSLCVLPGCSPEINATGVFKAAGTGNPDSPAPPPTPAAAQPMTIQPTENQAKAISPAEVAAAGEAASPPVPEGTVETATPQGPMAPDFTVTATSGVTVSLRSQVGKVVLLNFWATWCTSCRGERAALQRAYEKHQDDGFVVLAVAIDGDMRSVTAYTQELGLTFPTALDADGSVGAAYRVFFIPVSFLIDRSGRIHVRYSAPMTEEKIELYLARLL